VDIALLYFEGCPQARAAEANLRAAIADLDIGDAGEEAARVGFLGSPTILIDGHDPFAAPGATPGLSRRVYATHAGLVGTPTVAQFRDVLRGDRPDL
jgi:hypothetical protein